MQTLALPDFVKRFMDACAAALGHIRAMFRPLQPEPALIEAPEVDTFREAVSTLERWYYNEVRSTANCIVEELRNRRYISEEDEDQYVWEVCDGHEFIIYTFKARCVLLATDNADAYEEIHGDNNASVEQQAFFACEADVRRFMEYAYEEEGVSNA